MSHKEEETGILRPNPGGRMSFLDEKSSIVAFCKGLPGDPSDMEKPQESSRLSTHLSVRKMVAMLDFYLSFYNTEDNVSKMTWCTQYMRFHRMGAFQAMISFKEECCKDYLLDTPDFEDGHPGIQEKQIFIALDMEQTSTQRGPCHVQRQTRLGP